MNGICQKTADATLLKSGFGLNPPLMPPATRPSHTDEPQLVNQLIEDFVRKITKQKEKEQRTL